MFDECGTAPDDRGFRGWSSGTRTAFVTSKAQSACVLRAEVRGPVPAGTPAGPPGPSGHDQSVPSGRRRGH